MSYGITPIAVDLKIVQSFVGSKNRELIEAIIAESADDAESINEMAADHVDEDDPEDEPLTIAKALTRLGQGEELTGPAFVYGYALEFVCRHFGEFMDNSKWSGMRLDWFDTVGAALKQAGVSTDVFSTSNLVFRGPPMELPPIDDFPSIGFLRRQEIAAARAALADKKVAAINDPDVRASLMQICKWFDACTASKCDLICFYY